MVAVPPFIIRAPFWENMARYSVFDKRGIIECDYPN
jgi:hypothetical protein